MTYKLYWTLNSGALGPHLLLEEAGLPYEIVSIDFRKGENRTPEYLAINPIGYVPALQSEDGEVIYETAAIMMHLAEKHGLDQYVPLFHDPARGNFLKQLFFMTASVQYLFHIVYNPERYCGEGNSPEPATARANELVIERWQVFDDTLRERGPFFLGERYSMLDLFAAMMATWAPLEKLLETYPAYAKNFASIVNRPAIKKILAEHELNLPTS